MVVQSNKTPILEEKRCFPQILGFFLDNAEGSLSIRNSLVSSNLTFLLLALHHSGVSTSPDESLSSPSGTAVLASPRGLESEMTVNRYTRL